MAYIYRNGRRWRAQIDKQGVRLSETFDTKREAEVWAAEQETEISRGRSGQIPDKTFGDLLEKYANEVSVTKKSGKWETFRINLVRRYPLADVRLRDLDATHFAKYRDARLKEVAEPSVRREWNILHHAINVAINEWKWLRENPMGGVRRPSPGKARDRLPKPEEIEQLQVAAGYPGPSLSAKVMGAFLFACETGMRMSEICGLEKIDGTVARLADTKNGDARAVPLSAEALRIWEESGPFVMEPARMEALWRKIRSKTTVDGLHFHDSRHAAATKHAQNPKLHVLDLCRIMGWRNPKQAMTYYNLSAEDIAKKL